MSNFKEFKIKLVTETDNKPIESTIKSLEEYQSHLEYLNTLKTKPGIDPKELEKINKEIDDLEKSFKDAGNQIKESNKALEISEKNLKALRKEQKGLSVDSARYKELAQQIEDVQDGLDAGKKSAKSFGEQLEEVDGPIGMLARGWKKVTDATSTFGGALKATGIGLLVSIIGGITAAFAGNENAVKKFQPILIQLQKILGGLFRVFEPLLDSFLEMAEVALPYITKGIGIFYSGLVGLFTYIKEAGTGVAKIWKGIFTLDLDSVEEGINQIKNSFSKAADESVKAYGRFTAGTKELTATEKEELEKRKEAQEKAAQAAKERREEELKKQKESIETSIELEKRKADTNEEILRKLLEKKDELDNEEILKEKQKLEKKKNLTKEEKERLQAIKDLLELQRQNRENAIKSEIQSDKDGQKKLIEQREQSYKELLDKLKSYLEKEQKQIETSRNQRNKKDLQTLKQNLLDGLITEEQFQLQSLQKNKEFAEQKQKDDENAYLKNKGALILSLVGRQIDTETFNNALTDLNNNYNTQKTENEIAVTDTSLALQQYDFDNKKKYAEQYVQVKQAETETVLAQQMAQADAFSFLGGILQSFAGNSKEVAIAGLLIEQGANVARIITQSSASIAGATAQANLVPPIIPPAIPNPAFPIAQANLARSIATTKLQAGIGIASTIAATVQGIGQINQAFKEKKDQGKKQKGGILRGPLHQQGGILTPYGELEGGEYVINRAATSMFRPQLDKINSLGGGDIELTQSVLSGTINQPMEPPIIKTYVVAQDMSSQQELDRVIRDRSKI